MARKRLTQIMPFLIPIRSWQRNLFYQIGMYFDKNIYAKQFGNNLPYEVSSAKTVMINEESGQDIIYQKNKVHNLKIISQTMNKVYIYPHETFSFYYLSRNSKKYGKYKEGLILINNKIVPRIGGGICHLSNLLYYVFLMTPLTVVERHGHKVKSFPNPDKNSLDGVDATISRGWLDLKVRNDTENIYQIVIDFDDEHMYAKILSDVKPDTKAVIQNENFKYIRKNDKIFESVEVVKEIREIDTNELLEKKKLYDEIVEVNYELPKNIKIEDVEK